MKIKEITGEKELKVVMPSGKYMSVKVGLVAEVEKDKVVDWDMFWDTINQQLLTQAGQFDASWIDIKNYINYDKITVKIPNKVKPTDLNDKQI